MEDFDGVFGVTLRPSWGASNRIARALGRISQICDKLWCDYRRRQASARALEVFPVLTLFIIRERVLDHTVVDEAFPGLHIGIA